MEVEEVCDTLLHSGSDGMAVHPTPRIFLSLEGYYCCETLDLQI